MNSFIILSRITNVIYIICLIVVIFFAIVFISISALYSRAKKKLYINKLEDKNVQKDVDIYYQKIVNSKKDNEDLYKTVERRKSNEKKLLKFWNVFLIVIYVFVLGFLVYGAVNRIKGTPSFVNNIAPLVIETSSMEDVSSSNNYIKDNNLEGKENRLEQYAYITINNNENVINNISTYDVVAFKMPVMQEGKQVNIIVVHRLIEIKTDSNGEKLYTFRGDANPLSLASEVNVSKDRIVGVYQSKDYKGAYNLGFGYFVVYIQSSIGIITVAVAFLLLVIYSFLFKGITDSYDVRFLVLLNEKLKSKSNLTPINNKVIAEIKNTEVIENKNVSKEDKQVKNTTTLVRKSVNTNKVSSLPNQVKNDNVPRILSLPYSFYRFNPRSYSRLNKINFDKEVDKKEKTLLRSASRYLVTKSYCLKETDIVDKLVDGFYFVENGENHLLRKNHSIYNMDEYVYSGKINKGIVSFSISKDGQLVNIPALKQPNYGYTFEGLADEVFKVGNALECYNEQENRSFIYINEDSFLTFIGDPLKQYNVYIRLFDNEFGFDNDRWLVVYVEEEK